MRVLFCNRNWTRCALLLRLLFFCLPLSCGLPAAFGRRVLIHKPTQMTSSVSDSFKHQFCVQLHTRSTQLSPQGSSAYCRCFYFVFSQGNSTATDTNLTSVVFIFVFSQGNSTRMLMWIWRITCCSTRITWKLPGTSLLCWLLCSTDLLCALPSAFSEMITIREFRVCVHAAPSRTIPEIANIEKVFEYRCSEHCQHSAILICLKGTCICFESFLTYIFWAMAWKFFCEERLLLRCAVMKECSFQLCHFLQTMVCWRQSSQSWTLLLSRWRWPSICNTRTEFVCVEYKWMNYCSLFLLCT